MESPEQKELERFIHQQLQRLPAAEAPADLVQNVMKAIEMRENLPWWKQPFTFWPRKKQALLFAALATIFTAVCYFAWAPAEKLTAGSLLERAQPFGWVAGVAETIFGCLMLALRNMPWTWLAAAAGILVVMYCACVGAGVALYRVAAHRPLRTS